MATVSLTISPLTGPPGTVITATYALSGADTVDHSITVNPGTVVLDGTTLTSPTAQTFSLVHSKTIGAPTGTGLTFAATANPLVFTAVAPAS